MSFLSNIFKGKNENFYKAKAGLIRTKKSFDGFILSFPDITSDEIMFIKNKWERLPKSIASGTVKIMALNFNDEIKLLLTSYLPNSYILPHKHLSESEIGIILEGKLTNMLTGEVFNVGDKYYFPPNELHYLQSHKNGCLVQSALTTNASYKLKTLTKNTIKTLKLA